MHNIKILVCCFLQTLGPKSISAKQSFFNNHCWLHKIKVLNDWIPKVCASGDKSRISRMRHKSEARIRKPANSGEFPFSLFFFLSFSLFILVELNNLWYSPCKNSNLVFFFVNAQQSACRFVSAWPLFHKSDLSRKIPSYHCDTLKISKKKK